MAGTVQVYEQRNAKWCLQTVLTASDASKGAGFGAAVAVDGATVIIGADHDGANGKNSGAVYFFEKLDSRWRETGKITASDGAAGDLFGSKLALDGDTLIVGADGDDGRTSDSGSAYVFLKQQNRWIESQKLGAFEGEEKLQRFGYSLALLGDTAVIGTNPMHRPPPACNRVGAAYIFARRDGRWEPEQKLEGSSTPPGVAFGCGVALLDGIVLVRSTWPLCDGARTTGTDGALHVFCHREGRWERHQILVGLTGSGGAHSTSIAASNGSVIVGLPGASCEGKAEGEVVVYRWTSP